MTIEIWLGEFGSHEGTCLATWRGRSLTIPKRKDYVCVGGHPRCKVYEIIWREPNYVQVFCK